MLYYTVYVGNNLNTIYCANNCKKQGNEIILNDAVKFTASDARVTPISEWNRIMNDDILKKERVLKTVAIGCPYLIEMKEEPEHEPENITK